MPRFNPHVTVAPLAVGEVVSVIMVTAAAVADEPNDAVRLFPMGNQAEDATGTIVPLTLADAGYFETCT